MLAGSFQIADIVDARAARGLVPRLELRSCSSRPSSCTSSPPTAEVSAHPLRPARGRDRARRRLPHRVLLDALRAHPDGRVHQHDHGRGARAPTSSSAAGTRASPACRPTGCSASCGGAPKVAFLLFVFIWLRGTLPRFRYDQLMHFGWKVLIPVAAVWILVTAAGVTLLAGLGGAADGRQALFYASRPRSRVVSALVVIGQQQPDLLGLRAHRDALLAVRDLRPARLALHRRAAGDRLRRARSWCCSCSC